MLHDHRSCIRFAEIHTYLNKYLYVKATNHPALYLETFGSSIKLIIRNLHSSNNTPKYIRTRNDFRLLHSSILVHACAGAA